MSLVKSSKTGGNIYTNKTSNPLKSARVVDVIVDINHPLAEEYGGHDAIGTIFYSLLENINQNQQSGIKAPTATPLFTHLKYIPLINEIVLVLTTNTRDIYSSDNPQKSYYLSQINMWGHPHHNALPTSQGNDGLSSADYVETEAGITRQVVDEGTDIRLGTYFKEQLDIKPLLPYEGDLILEGRFGNSIRFGSTNIGDNITETNGWSNSGETGDPITIIRNGQSPNLDGKGWTPTTEQINEDPSSIYLCSNQQLANFVQASPFMDSWDMVYVRPRTLEEEMLQPEVDNITETSTPLDNTENSATPPPGNEEADVDNPAGPTNAVTDQNSDPLNALDDPNKIEDAGGETEGEEGVDHNSGIDKESDPSLGDEYEDPGTGGPDGGEDSYTYEFDFELPAAAPPAVQDNTNYSGGNAGFGGF